MPIKVRLQREPFDPAAEAAELTRGRTDIGGERRLDQHEADTFKWQGRGIGHGRRTAMID